ncbi:MAG: APC family permease [Candidatus Omnitrophica bacterium]|nr:APC family permease [Candidatus Omnitrophota bacterium]
MIKRLKRWLLGAPRNILDPTIYHKISLVALLAWVGLGADGLSSSAYGPEEAFRALGHHTYLAVALTLATAFTVFIISYAYSRIIEHFPYGGGGYVVASRLLGPRFGVVSGSALLIDYVLTISVSIASGADQVFSVLPPEAARFKLMAEAVVIGLLVLLNLRGVKESVAILTPIFGLFLVTHAILIFGGIGSHLFVVPQVASDIRDGFQSGWHLLGLFGMFNLFMRAYAMGGGTYTGIEAVSNGLQIMREPKIHTGRKTMLYMAVSLAITAGGILLCYLLFHVMPEPGKTMNAVLLERFAGAWKPLGLPLGRAFVILALAAEAGLLFVAAQAGFIDGPRVMSNMALDSWLPHRFAQLSDRLTMKNGVFLIGAASLGTLFYTRGNITMLVTMYSINVFLTFSLTELGMSRFWIRKRKKFPEWKQSLPIHLIGLCLCSSILTVVIIEKFRQGAWMTLVITSLLIGLCFWIKRHYEAVKGSLIQLEETIEAAPTSEAAPVPLRRHLPTAVMLVGRYGGLGIHGLLSIEQLFPKHYKNFIFISIGVIDAAGMKGVEEVERIQERTKEGLERYVRLARGLGLAADYRMSVGVEVLTEAEKLCAEIAKEFPKAMFFTNKLIFEDERWFQRLLHNETAYQLQRRLQFAGLHSMVLPVRIFIQPQAA